METPAGQVRELPKKGGKKHVVKQFGLKAQLCDDDAFYTGGLLDTVNLHLVCVTFIYVQILSGFLHEL